MNQTLECNVCGSHEYFHDDISDGLTCQTCGAVISLEQIHTEQNIAEYQRSLFATTSIASQLLLAEEYQFEEPIISLPDSGRAVSKSIQGQYEFDSISDIDLNKLLNNDRDYMRIYQYQQLIFKIINDLHVNSGLPDITKLALKVWKKYLYKSCQLGASKQFLSPKRFLSPKHSTIEFIKISSLNIDIALSLVLLCYIYCGCGIVANDLIKLVYRGDINLNKFKNTLSFKIKPLHSSQYMELMALKINKVIQLDMSKCKDTRFKNLVYRGCKHLCLPKYVAKISINHWITSESNIKMDDVGIKNSISYIYGIGKYGYTIPVEAAGVILYMCRRIWPVFLIPPPPLPYKPHKVSHDSNKLNTISLIDNKDSFDSLLFNPGNMSWVVSTVKPMDDNAMNHFHSLLLHLRDNRELIPKYKPFICRSFRSIITQIQNNDKISIDSIDIPNDVDSAKSLLTNIKIFECVEKSVQDTLIDALDYLHKNDIIAYNYVKSNNKSNYTLFKKFIVDYISDKCHKKFFEGIHNRFYNYTDYFKLRCDSSVWLRQRGYWSGLINNNNNNNNKIISSNQVYYRILNKFIHSDCWSVERCIDRTRSIQLDSLNNDLIQAISLATTKKSGDDESNDNDGPWKSLSSDIFNRLKVSIHNIHPPNKIDNTYRDKSKHISKDVFKIVQNLPISFNVNNNDDLKGVYYELNNTYFNDSLGNPALYVLSLVLLANFFGVQRSSIHQCIKVISQ